MHPIRLPDRPLKCLHLGDSYTIGEGVPSTQTWAHQLEEQLRTHGTAIDTVRVLAQTGWTSGDLLEAIRRSELKPEWDFITLCIGVNNQYQGLDPASYGNELNRLIAEARHLLAEAEGSLLLLSIPDWSVSLFARDLDRATIANQIDAFNAVAARVAQSSALQFADWTILSRTFKDVGEAFTADELHPSGKQYTHWARFVGSLIQTHPND